MIGKKINQLATELAPVSTDLTIIGDPDSGVSKKITLAQLGAIFSGAVSFYTNLAAFPATGDINVIYCAKDTQKLYLWSGSAYVEVFPSQALLDTYQLRSEKGNANGYASLDSGGKVPISQLPSSIMEYKGTWNASTNTPTLANGTGDTGDVYICNVAGTVNFGAGPLTFAVGDYVIYSGSIWQRSSGAVGTVTSVALTVGGDAISVSGSPLTTSGTLGLTFNGTTAQYIRGNGTLETFPTSLISGTGNVNAIPKFTANTVLGNSVMEDDGNFVSMRGLKINAVAGVGNTINFQQGSGITAAGLGYSTIGAASTTGFAFYIDQNTTSRSFILDTSTITSATQLTYSLPASSGTLALTSDIPSLTGYVPYTGATANVNLGTHTLIAAKGTFSSSGSGDTVGITHSSGSGIALNITKGGNGEGLYINKTSGSGNAATIIGTLNATTLVKSGGTSAQFLKADGSVDSTSYGTGSVTSVGLSSATSGVTIGSTPITTSGTITLAIATASGSQQGLLSSTDWTTFNNKQNALTNPVTGTGTTNYLPKFTGASTIGNSVIQEASGSIGINVSPVADLQVGKSSGVTIAMSNSSSVTSGTRGGISWYNSSVSTVADIRAVAVTDNVGTQLEFYTRPVGGSLTQAMTLNASGNLGLGVNPSAWGSTVRALQFENGGSIASNQSTQVSFNNNVYSVPGTNDYYISSAFATRYIQFQGQHIWSTAPSGTAGNAISFTQAMTLDASGRLGVGTTSLNNLITFTQTIGGSPANLSELEPYATLKIKGRPDRNNIVYVGAIDALTGMLIQSGTTSTAANLALNPFGGNVGIGTSSPLGSSAERTIHLSDGGGGFATVYATNSANTVRAIFGMQSSQGLCVVGSQTNNPLAIYTNDTERMRITSGGNVLVNNTTDRGYILQTNSNSSTGAMEIRQNNAAGDIPLTITNEATSGTRSMITFQSGGFGVAGTITSGNTSTSYNTSSDYRLKQDIKDFNGLDLLSKLKAYDYEWKSDGSRMYGVIAHELQSVINYAVTGVKDGKEMQGVDYSKIVPVLIKAIQEQQTQIEQLKNK
jgi:hypothetical protein